MTTEAAKAARWLRNHRVQSTADRAMCERAATLVDLQAAVLEEQRRLLDDQAREIQEQRVLLAAVRAVVSADWLAHGAEVGR